MINEEQSTEAVVASMIVGSVLGIGGGMLAARREISRGTAKSANLGSLWGLWFGGAGSILFDLGEDPAWATTMLTGNAGLIGGALAGSRWPPSRSPARLISVGGLIGGVAGGGILLIAEPDDEEMAIAVPQVPERLRYSQYNLEVKRGGRHVQLRQSFATTLRRLGAHQFREASPDFSHGGGVTP